MKKLALIFTIALIGTSSFAEEIPIRDSAKARVIKMVYRAEYGDAFSHETEDVSSAERQVILNKFYRLAIQRLNDLREAMGVEERFKSWLTFDIGISDKQADLLIQLIDQELAK